MTTHIVTEAGKRAKVEAELAELVADGVAVAVTADQLVAAEAQGVILDVLTGKPTTPLLALDRQVAQYRRGAAL